jgi:hypothetical protein
MIDIKTAVQPTVLLGMTFKICLTICMCELTARRHLRVVSIVFNNCHLHRVLVDVVISTMKDFNMNLNTDYFLLEMYVVSETNTHYDRY